MFLVKKIMLEGCLCWCLWVIDIEIFDEYCDYLFKYDGLDWEVIYLMDVVIINKIDFFCELKYFEYMFEKVFFIFFVDGYWCLCIWSVVVLIGVEVYMIVMVMEEFLCLYNSMDYNIFVIDLFIEVFKIV